MRELKIHKVGIRFGDNDFSKTFIAFLKAVGYYPDFKEDTTEGIKDALNHIYNLSILGMYIAGQNRLQYSNGLSMSEHLEEVEKYLVKDEKNQKLFYINEEVDEFLEKCEGNDNGEFHYVEILLNDLGEVQEPKVYSI